MATRFIAAIAASLLALPVLAAIGEPAGLNPRLRASADEEPSFMLSGKGEQVFECRPRIADVIIQERYQRSTVAGIRCGIFRLELRGDCLHFHPRLLDSNARFHSSDNEYNMRMTIVHVRLTGKLAKRNEEIVVHICLAVIIKALRGYADDSPAFAIK